MTTTVLLPDEKKADRLRLVCPGCRAAHLIKANGRVAAHGYTLTWGYQAGSCPCSDLTPPAAFIAAVDSLRDAEAAYLRLLDELDGLFARYGEAFEALRDDYDTKNPLSLRLFVRPTTRTGRGFTDYARLPDAFGCKPLLVRLQQLDLAENILDYGKGSQTVSAGIKRKLHLIQAELEHLLPLRSAYREAGKR